MILQALHKLLLSRKINELSPLDLANWVEGRIKLCLNGSIWIGEGETISRSGYVFNEASKILKGPKRTELFDHDIMDRFWQNGKLILVTKDFRVFDESSCRVYQSRCGICQIPANSPAELRWQRLTGTCLRHANLLASSALWTSERGLVCGRLRVWYVPVLGLLKKL